LGPAYTEYGDRRNPTILFLHGIRLGRDIWAQHASMLADRYHVIALDLPGHGSLAQMPFSEHTIGALLEDTIKRHCAGPPLIVGYSLGGYVAMQYASQRPQHTRGLVLAGCTLDFSGWHHWPYGVSARLAELIPEQWYDTTSHFILHLLMPKAWADLVEAIPFNRKVLSRTNATIAGHYRFSKRIARYRKPVLFINGAYDFIFRSDERRFLARLPQARLKLIGGVDHTAPLLRVAEFTHLVREFADHVFAASP